MGLFSRKRHDRISISIQPLLLDPTNFIPPRPSTEDREIKPKAQVTADLESTDPAHEPESDSGAAGGYPTKAHHPNDVLIYHVSREIFGLVPAGHVDEYGPNVWKAHIPPGARKVQIGHLLRREKIRTHAGRGSTKIDWGGRVEVPGEFVGAYEQFFIIGDA